MTDDTQTHIFSKKNPKNLISFPQKIMKAQ